MEKYNLGKTRAPREFPSKLRDDEARKSETVKNVEQLRNAFSRQSVQVDPRITQNSRSQVNQT